MNRKEYQQIFLEWQNFLNNSTEESSVLSEAVILENLVLHESLKKISAKFGREGLLYLASLAIPALLPSHVQAENLEGNIPRHQIAAIKKLSQDPGVIESLEQAVNSNSVGEEIGDPQEILNFRRGLDEKVFTEENMDVSLLSGVFIKETYKDGFQNKEAIQKIAKKVKKIISSNSSDRSFYIKVNNKKYIVIVDADSSTSRDDINDASRQISDSIVEDVVGRFKSKSVDVRAAAKICKRELAHKIESHVKSSFDNLRDGSYGSFMSVNQFSEVFYKCFSLEYDFIEKGNKDFEILSAPESLHGIITIDTPLIKSLTDGKLASTLKHEIGHLLSSQATQGDLDVIDTNILETFYLYLEKEAIGSHPGSFSLSDIAKFIFMHHCKKHGAHLSENAFLFLKDDVKQILLKKSKRFANQLLSSDSVEIKNKKLSFVVDYNFYYSNLEERVENLKSWMLSINSDQKAEKAESFLKSFYSYLNDGDYENDVKEYLKDRSKEEFNHWESERIVKDFIKTLINKDNKAFSNSDLYRFNMLLNFQGYSTGKQEGHKRLKSSVKNLLTLFENHIEHSH